MNKVLVISYYWPPMGGGGVQRWLKTIKYLRQYKWEPIVFTVNNSDISLYDDSLLYDVPDGIEVISSNIWEPFSLYRIFTGKKDEKINPGFLSKKKGVSFLNNLSIWIRGNFFIPDAKMFWYNPAIKTISRYLQNNKVDAIVSTGPPHTTHLIALFIKKKFDIPWLADFRDPWTNIDFYDKLKLTKWADKRHRRLEMNVLLNANKLVTVSKSWAKDFFNICGRKPDVITNGYDPADFNKAVVHCFTGTQKQLDDYLELDCYIGVTGWICDEKRNVELRKTIKNIPLSKLMVETDCPYLIPKDLPTKPKNNRNEPSNLNHIVKEISLLLDLNEDEIRKESFKNTLRFFESQN